ncbi:hypothetical protein [Nocardia lijiangensis]|uniref:hypothetical protein n=1 Tax=Nocardia lijiangensis TaxID=299618 RepID=UPI000831CF96|nr:hypothetical protein [Nocardia lijiangensis]
MSDAFFTVKNRPRSVTGIRRTSGGGPQSLEQSIPDGDTTGVHVQGSMLVLRAAQRYFEILNPEDRLYIPQHFVPIFVSRGWRLENGRPCGCSGSVQV